MSSFKYAKKGDKYYLIFDEVRDIVPWKKRWIPNWYEEEIIILPESMILTDTSVTTERGNEYTLTVTFSPNGVTNKNVKWESSDESVLTVDGGHVVTLKVGTATVTATSEADPTLKAVCSFTITPKQYIVSFDANGGSGEMAAVARDENTMYPLPECTFTAPDTKSFQSWQVGSNTYAPGEEILIDSSKQVVALWE